VVLKLFQVRPIYHILKSSRPKW